MASEPAHIVDAYAYAVLLACANEDRTRSRIYVSNTQRRRMDEMFDAGWLRMDGRFVRTTEAGAEAMHHMRCLLDDLHDDLWEGQMDEIDEVRDRQSTQVLAKKKERVTERREGP